MKRLVLEGIFGVGTWIGGYIRRGRVPFVVVGAVIGAAIGSALGLVMWPWAIAGVMLGGLTGAFCLAFLFPAPEPPPLAASFDGQPFNMGMVVQLWRYEWEQYKGIAVLLERAIYVTPVDGDEWQFAQDRLHEGLDPNLPNGDLIPISAVSRLEIVDCGFSGLDICFVNAGNSKTRGIFFSTPEDRSNFLAQLTNQLGCPLVSRSIPDGFFASTWAPLSILSVLTILLVGGMLLADYWIANPPPPVQRTGKQDPLVLFLTWLEPAGVALALGPLLALIGAWFVFRIVKRTNTHALIPENSVVAIRDS